MAHHREQSAGEVLPGHAGGADGVQARGARLGNSDRRHFKDPQRVAGRTVMRLFNRALDGIRRVVQKSRVERELDEELRAYLEMTADEKSAVGIGHTDALRIARGEVGSLEALKDRVRDVGWESVIEGVGRDVRFALRLFRKHPGFVLAVIATVAIGVGGTTAIFSVVDGLFLRPPSGVTAASSLRKVFIKRNAG